jgi:hypothetical protein
MASERPPASTRRSRRLTAGLARCPSLPASRPHWLLIALVALSCAPTVAGCGTSSTRNRGVSNTHAQAVRYADCVRAHGVSDFPDPSPGGGFNLRALGSEAGSPTLLAAQTACANMQPGGSGRPAPFTGEQQRQMVAKAQCIRTHGVPNLPDPMTVSDGMFGEPNLPPGWNPEAAAIVKATKACARVGIPIPSPDGAVGD